MGGHRGRLRKDRLALNLLVQHHPSRAELVKRLAPWPHTLVPDPFPGDGPNPWRTYLRCLEAGVALGEPFVIMQDDCIPCTGFLEAAEGARRAKPDVLIAFCVQGMARRSCGDILRALDRGERWARYWVGMWVPALALGWTPELADRCLEWDALAMRPARETADDGRIGMFCKRRGVEVWATVPCLVDHPDDVPSFSGASYGGRPTRRPIALYEGDASEITDW